MTKHRKNQKNFNRIVTSCSECDGSGKHKPQLEQCPDCYGTGRFVKKTEKPCKCSEKHRDNCKRCHGSGTRTFYNGVVDCRRCQTTGKILMSSKCSICGDQPRNKRRAMVGTLEEVWPTV